MTLSADWNAAKAERRAGCCVICDRPLSGRKRVLCGRAACANEAQRIYQRAYVSQRRQAEREHAKLCPGDHEAAHG